MDLARTLETIQGPGYAIQVFVVPWDTAIFGYPVAQVDRIEIAVVADVGDAMNALATWLHDHGIRLASCRLASLKLRESMALESAGFRFVEMVYAPSLSPLPVDLQPDRELAIVAAGPEDATAVEEIAGTAFSTGRYLLDWRLDGSASHRRYQTWVRNALSDSTQRVLKVQLRDAIVGFFIVEERGDGSVYWHLTAVAPEWQGKGLGRRIWTAMAAMHRSAGSARIDTTISAHNAPVINIYAGLGFRFGAPQSTFHWVAR